MPWFDKQVWSCQTFCSARTFLHEDLPLFFIECKCQDKVHWQSLVSILIIAAYVIALLQCKMYTGSKRVHAHWPSRLYFGKGLLHRQPSTYFHCVCCLLTFTSSMTAFILSKNYSRSGRANPPLKRNLTRLVSERGYITLAKIQFE